MAEELVNVDERHELLTKMFPSLSVGQVVGALRARGGDAQRASLFLTSLGCVSANTFEEISQEDGEESDEETRAVSDEDVTRLVTLDFDAAAAAAALRRSESVDDAAMWLLDSPDRGLSVAAADARKREAEDRTKAERAARRAAAATARVPEAALELDVKQQDEDEEQVATKLAEGFHGDVGIVEQCSVCGIVGKVGCRGCGVCGLCSSAVARCPALPNGGYHHAHRLSLVATARVKRSCDICRILCQVAWRCLPCDFDACPACVAVVPPGEYRRTGHGRGTSENATTSTTTAPIVGSPALLFYEEDGTHPPLLGSSRKRVYAKFEAGTIAREAAARWDNDDDDEEEEQVLVDQGDNNNNDVRRRMPSFSRRQLGCGVVRDVAPGTLSSEAEATSRSHRLSSSSSRMTSKRRRLARGATGPALERKIGHDETAVLVDFYAASSDKSATRLTTAETLLAESNRVDVAGRRALESALALANLDLASQLLLGSLRAAKKSVSSSARRTECCAVCFGSAEDGRLDFFCLGAASGGHALHAACAADLALGGGDCPSCRAPIFYAGVASAEVAAAKEAIDEETRRRSSTSTLRPGDCVIIAQDSEKCRKIMSSPENGGWYSDMEACCGKHAVVTAAVPEKGLFDVKFVEDGGSVVTWRLDKRILTLSLAGGGSAGAVVTTDSSNRPNDDHDSTLSFVRECSRRLRVELVAIKRRRDTLQSESEGKDLSSSSSDNAVVLSRADVRRGKHLVDNLCSDLLKPRIQALVDSGDLDSAARAVRRDNAASLSEAAVWVDAVKPGTYQVAKETWLELRTRPEPNAPRTGYRLNPGTVFAASRHRLGSNCAEQKDLWLKVGEVLVDSRKQPDGTSSNFQPSEPQRRALLILESAGSAVARSTSTRSVWARGDDVLFSHLPDSIGARVVRGRDWTFGNQDGLRSEGDPLPLGEIIGPARPRGAVRVRWLGRDYANDYHAGADDRCDLKYADDAPAELPKPQGWVRARLGGPGTRFAVKPVFKSLRCCACGDDLSSEHEHNSSDSSKTEEANTASALPFPSSGQEALVAATLERVKIVSVESESRKHCVCTFPGEDDEFEFRTQDLVPAKSLESSDAPEEDDEATVEYQGFERTRRELVLAVDGDVAKAKRIWTTAARSSKRYEHHASSLERATCVRGHPMHARCFQGRLVAGSGCPVCDEPLWVPPVRRLGTADDECSNNNRSTDRSSQEQRPASEPMRRVVRFGENCVFRLTSSERHDGDENDEEKIDSSSSSQLVNAQLQYSWSGVVFSELVLSITVNLVVERESSHMTVSVNNQPARDIGWVPASDLDALSQLASAVGATIQGNAIRPDTSSSSPSQVLRMCPVCYSGPLFNERCADLRAHHMQCSNCPARVPYADTRLAEALSQLAPSTPVGECIPRCHACNTRVTFNGCMQCGKLFASMSWEALPKWDPMAKARLESVQRERNEMRALANEVRNEAALLEHESREYREEQSRKSPAVSTTTPSPHRFWYEPPLPPAFFPGNTKPLQVSCDENCTLRHLNGDCLVCGLDWGEHSGHNCPDGQRGSWFLDYTEEEDD